MRRALALTVVLAALCTPAGAADDDVHVQGILAEISCYAAAKSEAGSADRLAREDLLGCGAENAKAGLPVVLVPQGRADAPVITISSPSFLLAEHLGKDARIDGREIAPRVVQPSLLEVRARDGWWEVVPVEGMMLDGGPGLPIDANGEPHRVGVRLPEAGIAFRVPADVLVGDAFPIEVRVAPAPGARAPETVRTRLGMPEHGHWITPESSTAFAPGEAIEHAASFPMEGRYRLEVRLDYPDGRTLDTGVDFTVGDGRAMDPAPAPD